ncbi:MAG TPA: polysaccharide biosynthesis/export family protein [Blastocatellia bacterium]|nr:polysaccharide biosynthesis/export family protein [Blastocatellia bacterium]
MKCCFRLFQQVALVLPVLLLMIGTGPAQTQSEAAQSRPRSAAYRIHKGDKLSIKFLYQPELSEPSVVVRPDGFISLQMIGDLRAEGLTITELKKAVEEAYNEQLLRPEVSVSLLEFVAPRVFVGGQVQKPGSYELRAAQTVLQAVIVAGGFTREASRKTVLHARPVGERELKVTVVDLKQLLSAQGSGQENELQDGDYVFVPDSKLSKFNQMVEAFRFAMPGFTIR